MILCSNLLEPVEEERDNLTLHKEEFGVLKLLPFDMLRGKLPMITHRGPLAVLAAIITTALTTFTAAASTASEDTRAALPACPDVSLIRYSYLGIHIRRWVVPRFGFFEKFPEDWGVVP